MEVNSISSHLFDNGFKNSNSRYTIMGIILWKIYYVDNSVSFWSFIVKNIYYFCGNELFKSCLFLFNDFAFLVIFEVQLQKKKWITLCAQRGLLQVITI